MFACVCVCADCDVWSAFPIKIMVDFVCKYLALGWLVTLLHPHPRFVRRGRTLGVLSQPALGINAVCLLSAGSRTPKYQSSLEMMRTLRTKVSMSRQGGSGSTAGQSLVLEQFQISRAASSQHVRLTASKTSRRLHTQLRDA